MNSTVKLVVITPKGIYLEKDITELYLETSLGFTGFLPNHYPLISEVKVTPLMIQVGPLKEYYAAFGGVIKVEKERIILLLNDIEKDTDIDVERAERAKKRAEDRLAIKSEEIDYNRAKLSLLRALTRINTSNHKVGE